jgi:hypothetical protein
VVVSNVKEVGEASVLVVVAKLVSSRGTEFRGARVHTAGGRRGSGWRFGLRVGTLGFSGTGNSMVIFDLKFT